MSEFLFGTGWNRMPSKVRAAYNAIAKRHGATFTYMGDGDTHGSNRYWFSAPNWGSPFDSDTARAVESDLAKNPTIAAWRNPNDSR